MARAAETYRAARRNKRLREEKGVWRSFKPKYAGARVRSGKTYKPNGTRECDRRRRQYCAEQLTKSNGLVT